MIPYGKQNISEEDIAAVVNVLKDDWITQGPRITQFEESIARYTQSAGAVASNSATSSLHLACLALGFGSGQTLWTSPNTFVASSNVALHCGGEVDFVDIDERSHNICVNALEEKLEEAKTQDKLPSIVMPVHFAGQSCDMKKIHELSQEYGFKIIEDASHAIGGKYNNRPIGNCEYSDICVFSFHPVKIITSGEGGMATSQSTELLESMARLRTHGVTKNSSEFNNEADGPWYWEQIDLGLNYRMTDIHAALGLSQMKRLDKFVKRRVEVVGKYNSLLQGLPIDLPISTELSEPSWHLYVICLKEKNIKKKRELFEYLRSEGIGVNVHYMPVYKNPYYQKIRTYRELEGAENYYKSSITLPCYYDLKDEEIEYIADKIKKFFK